MAIERIVPGTIEWDAFYANHIGRYQFAKERINDLNATDILDAACGVGYGSFLLGADDRLKITGVDNSKDALDVAGTHYKRKNIEFRKDDCHTLTNASDAGPFDCIVSFETLEHLPRPEVFIESCFENLSASGELIVSTPNQLVSSPEGKIDWEFHEKEYTPGEFVRILSAAGFSSVNLFGQQMTSIGKLRAQIRAELHKINSNPFLRMGRTAQRLIRGHRFSAVLPEQAEDFEIRPYSDPEELSRLGDSGPFVMIAVCTK
jgi:SAM-dependent methyltransferase